MVNPLRGHCLCHHLVATWTLNKVGCCGQLGGKKLNPLIPIMNQLFNPFIYKYIYILHPVGAQFRRGLSSATTIPATEEELEAARATWLS